MRSKRWRRFALLSIPVALLVMGFMVRRESVRRWREWPVESLSVKPDVVVAYLGIAWTDTNQVGLMARATPFRLCDLLRSHEKTPVVKVTYYAQSFHSLDEHILSFDRKNSQLWVSYGQGGNRITSTHGTLYNYVTDQKLFELEHRSGATSTISFEELKRMGCDTETW